MAFGAGHDAVAPHPLPPMPPSATVRLMSKKPEPSAVAAFEQSLDELEKLVASMEQGEMSLDDSLKAFERGIALFRQCQGALSEAEQRVSLLLDPQQPDSAKPFEG
jgi:exodeoxyribonuclease VII small subunit